MASEVQAIWDLIAEVVGEVWYVLVPIVGGSLVVALINAVKRGSNV